MNIEELKKNFIVDVDLLRDNLERLVTKALNHCKIDTNGNVLITDSKLPGKDQLMLTLVARGIASQLDSKISASVTVAEIRKFTGLPSDQIRARGQDLIKAKLAESTKRGTYRALSHKIEAFLDGISAKPGKR
jgi:hypothetical protein